MEISIIYLQKSWAAKRKIDLMHESLPPPVSCITVVLPSVDEKQNGNTLIIQKWRGTVE